MPSRKISSPVPLQWISDLQELEEEWAELPTGTYQIADKLPIFVRWEDRGASTTVVTFGGAVGTKVATLPAFQGARMSADLDANILLISDPTLQLDTSLSLAWYAGNWFQPSLQHLMTRIVLKFAGDTRIVLFGGSGGGFAALDQALRLRNVDVVVSNPQTVMERYWYFPRYLELAWGAEERFDHQKLPIRQEVVSHYSEPVEPRIVYIQNTRDSSHMQKHWGPFSAQLHPDNKVMPLFHSIGKGHVEPSRDTFVRVLEEVIVGGPWEEMKQRLAAVTLTGNHDAKEVLPEPENNGSQDDS